MHSEDFNFKGSERKNPVFQGIRPRVPCNHLLLLVGGVATAAQDFSRGGQEVEAVVFEVLVHQWQKNLTTQRGQ